MSAHIHLRRCKVIFNVHINIFILCDFSWLTKTVIMAYQFVRDFLLQGGRDWPGRLCTRFTSMLLAMLSAVAMLSHGRGSVGAVRCARRAAGGAPWACSASRFLLLLLFFVFSSSLDHLFIFMFILISFIFFLFIIFSSFIFVRFYLLILVLLFPLFQLLFFFILNMKKGTRRATERRRERDRRGERKRLKGE